MGIKIKHATLGVVWLLNIDSLKWLNVSLLSIFKVAIAIGALLIEYGVHPSVF